MRQHAKVWQEKVDMSRKENEWCLGQDQRVYGNRKSDKHIYAYNKV
jgi:hypothetical protein